MPALKKTAPEIPSPPQTKTQTMKTIAIVVILLLVGYGGYIVSVFGCALLGYETQCESRFAVFGQFGDSFGVVTSIATVGALILLCRAYLLQQKEFRQLGNVMTEQRKIMGAQHKAMSLQAFENTLFNMCKLYSEILSQTFIVYYYRPDMYSGRREKTVSGRAGLKYIIREPSDLFVKFNMEEFLKDKEKKFSPYEGCFRLLYRIFKFIAERDDLTEAQKQEYSRIPRAMLSNIELEAAILINCQTDRGWRMLKLAKRFNILDNYPDTTGVVLNQSAARTLFDRYNKLDPDKPSNQA